MDDGLFDEARYTAYQNGYYQAKNGKPLKTKEEYLKEFGAK